MGELASRILKSFFPSSLVGEDSIFLSPSFCITLGLLSVSPFNFFRTLDSLKYTSGFALLAVGKYIALFFFTLFFKAYLFCIVVGFAFIWPTGMPEKGWIKWDDVFWWNSDLSVTLHVMPIFVFAFTCHQNLFSIHNELSVQSKTKKAVDISVFSSLFIYQVVGILGYLTFGSSVSDNIISMCRISNFIKILNFLTRSKWVDCSDWTGFHCISRPVLLSSTASSMQSLLEQRH